MRRLIALAAAAAATACASMGQPPGGPPDKTPPQVLSISPDSGAVGTRPKHVVFQFDETVNDRAARGALDQYFLISPMDGAPDVSYHRSRIDVRPRHGFRANTAYTVTLLPGLGDIRGNISHETRAVVFSTGAELPRFGILGHVFDWANQRGLPDALVVAISRPDSTVYVAVADSTGGFDLGPIPAGRYSVQAWADQNKNRARDRTEIWDSTTVTITASRPIVDLFAIMRDTLPARLTSVALDDSLTMRLAFDHALDPAQTFATTQFRVVAADSSPVAIVRVLTPDQAEREHADSARRADSLAARADTSAAHRAAADSARRAALAPGTGRAIAAAPVKPSRPAPPTAVLLRLAPQNPARPGTYRVTASGIRSIVGVVGTSTRLLSVPRPPPRDTTRKTGADTSKARARGDTAKAKPPAASDTTRRPALPPAASDTTRKPALPPAASDTTRKPALAPARADTARKLPAVSPAPARPPMQPTADAAVALPEPRRSTSRSLRHG